MLPVNSPQFQKDWEEKLTIGADRLFVEMKKKFPKLEKTDPAYQKELILLAKDFRSYFHRMDFYLFLEDALEMKGLNKEFHGEMADFMQEKHDLKLMLAPRGHLKSTICTIGYALWRLMDNPDLRILIANYKLDNAKSFMGQAKQYFIQDGKFRFYYEKFIPSLKNAKWNDSQVTIKRYKNLKEASLEATGVGGEITGKHFDLIIYDDIVGPENVSTLEQAQKLRNWFNQMQAILEPGGEQVLVGTRWHYADLYGFLMESMGDGIKVFHKGVYKEDGTPVWPEKFTPAIVQKIRTRMESDPKSGRALFVAQYLNQVIDEATASFKRAKMRFFSPGEEPKGLSVSIAVDPAISEKESADRTAFTVRGVDMEGNWWILETIARRGMTPTEIVNMLFTLYERYNEKYSVDAIGVEAQSYQKSLIFSLQDEMKKRNCYFNLVELGNWRQSKELRIKSLIPRYDNGAILFRRPGTGDDSEILTDELLRFPKSAHDDCADSLSFHQALDVVAVPYHERDISQDEEIVNGRDRYGYPIEQTSGASMGFFI